MKIETEEYMDIERRQDIANNAKKLRRQFLRYKEAEVVYSILSDKIDEEDLAFAAHDFVTYEMAVQYYGLGLKAVTRIAWESGAVY